MAAIILAGGKGDRLGKPKASLRLGEKTLLEIVVERVSQRFLQVIIVASDPGLNSPLPVVVDEFPGCGPLGGLYTGLTHSPDLHNFVIACDMPFIRLELIDLLMSRIEGWDAVVPKAADGLHPLCAAYSRGCLDAIRQQLENGNLRVSSFLPTVKVSYLEEAELRTADPDLISLFNINSRQDYEQAKGIAAKGVNLPPR